MASLLLRLKMGLCVFKRVPQRPKEVILEGLVRMVVGMRLVRVGRQEEQEEE